MTHDFKAVLDDWPLPKLGLVNHGDIVSFFVRNEKAMHHALRVADKMMQGMSDKMLEAGYEQTSTAGVWLAMRDQMLKELKPPSGAANNR